MGPNLYSSLSPRTRLSAKIIGVGALFTLLASCISDGPNRTGGDYLGEHGILLQNPLYHIVIPAFPVDSIWTRDADTSHLGTTALMAGIAGQFSAQMRLGFDIDSLHLKSLVDATDSVKLSLRTYRSLAGFRVLKALVGDTALSDTSSLDAARLNIRDSLSFLVETWMYPNKDSAGGSVLTDAGRVDSVSRLNHSFLTRLDTTAVLGPVASLDTITLNIRHAYIPDPLNPGDSLQARYLPNLTKKLFASPKSTKWLVHFQLTPLSLPTDTRTAMLRLEGGTGTVNGPVLLFGKPTSAVTAVDSQKLAPVAVGTRFGVNYILRYGGSRMNILPAKNRELHMVLARAALIDSITQALRRTLNIEPSVGNINGKFDLTYFIPFGQLSLPLGDSLNLEGKLPVEMRMISDLDSLLPPATSLDGRVPVAFVPLDSIKPLIIPTDPNNISSALDTISIGYAKVSPSDTLRRVIVKFAKDTAQNDTTYITLGQSKDIVKTLRGSSSGPMIITITAGTLLEVAQYLNVHSVIEPNDLRDPATGVTLSSLSDRLPRLLRPGQDTLKLRATNGLQRILNRTDAGTDILSDLVVQGLSGVDTSVNTGSVIEPERVSFPVLSVIPPRLNAGKLTVRLELYLYPLKKER